MAKVVLLRHGQSEWNLQNRFTGWFDVDVTDQGAAEAVAAGATLAAAGLTPDIVHTSLQTRAIKTANLSLRKMSRLWIPVRRHWRLNERHYGGLTGLNKAETAEKYGDGQVHIWRRSYDVPPPAMPEDHPDNPNTDPRYARLPPDVLPNTECLKDVVERILPYWFDAIVPDLAIADIVLIAAHDNSLRALVKHLSGISDEEISNLKIPAAVPLVYEIGPDCRPVDDTPIEDRYLR